MGVVSHSAVRVSPCCGTQRSAAQRRVLGVAALKPRSAVVVVICSIRISNTYRRGLTICASAPEEGEAAGAEKELNVTVEDVNKVNNKNYVSAVSARLPCV